MALGTNVTARKVLEARGVKATMRNRGGSKEIFLTDPDNVSVRLTDVTYCGGSGPRGASATADRRGHLQNESG